MNLKLSISLLLTLFIIAACAQETPEQTVAAEGITLYEKIGGKVKVIVEDILYNHSKNPISKDRFAASGPEYVKEC